MPFDSRTEIHGESYDNPPNGDNGRKEVVTGRASVIIRLFAEVVGERVHAESRLVNEGRTQNAGI